MSERFTDIIRNEFDKGKEITLMQLYDALSKNQNVKLDSEKLKTRIRTTIYRLQKTHKVMKVKRSTYRKI